MSTGEHSDPLLEQLAIDEKTAGKSEHPCGGMFGGVLGTGAKGGRGGRGGDIGGEGGEIGGGGEMHSWADIMPTEAHVARQTSLM